MAQRRWPVSYARRRSCGPARGLYQLPDTQIEAAHMLAEAAVLVPKGVVCLTSALQYHELTLQMPSAVWMAIERTAWRPKIDYPRIRFVRFTGLALTEGIERHRVESVEVPIDDVPSLIDQSKFGTTGGIYNHGHALLAFKGDSCRAEYYQATNKGCELVYGESFS